MSLLLLALGCGCPDFEDITIEDPHGIASDYDHSAIRDAIDDFAAWTGRDGVCVPFVSIHQRVSDKTDDYSGMYHSASNKIRVEYASIHQMYWTTLHELCHALDAEALHIPRTAPDIFDGADPEIDPVSYPTVKQRRREDFARFCEWGPRELETLRALDDACGDGPRESPRSTYLNDMAYPAFVPEPAADVVLVSAPDRVPLAAPWGERAMIHDLAVRDGALLAVAVDNVGGLEWLHVARFAPDGSLRDSASVALAPLSTAWHWTIAPGDDEALLFADYGHHPSQYRWTAGEPALVKMNLLRFPSDVQYGLLRGDEIVLWGSSVVWRTPRGAPRWEALRPPTEASLWGHPSSDSPLLHDGQNLWRLEGGQWHAEPFRSTELPTHLDWLGASGDQLLAQWNVQLLESGWTSALAKHDPTTAETTLYYDCDSPNIMGGYSRLVWDEAHAVVRYDDGSVQWVPLAE